MNAHDMEFHTIWLGGGLLFSVLVHISNPEMDLAEAKRILRQNGDSKQDLNPFVGVHGGHDPRA